MTGNRQEPKTSQGARNRAPWTLAERAELEQFVAAGLSNRQIAQRLGRTENAIGYQLSRMRVRRAAQAAGDTSKRAQGALSSFPNPQ